MDELLKLIDGKFHIDFYTEVISYNKLTEPDLFNQTKNYKIKIEASRDLDDKDQIRIKLIAQKDMKKKEFLQLLLFSLSQKYNKELINVDIIFTIRIDDFFIKLAAYGNTPVSIFSNFPNMKDIFMKIFYLEDVRIPCQIQWIIEINSIEGDFRNGKRHGNLLVRYRDFKGKKTDRYAF